MTKTITTIFFISLFLFTGNLVCAQEMNNNFGPIEERLLVETRWKYAYTLHVESNSIVHKANEDYKHFLYLRYNYSYQEFLNGEFSKGWWSLDNRTLTYTFRGVEEFEIGNLNKRTLVLDFQQKNSKGNYQYHFVRVSESETPFVKPANELPNVLVEEIVTKKPKKPKENRWLFFRKRQKERQKSSYELAHQEPRINIELTGGGYYGGIDPVLKDIIHIKNDGRIIKEFHSKYNGQIVTKNNIDRLELEEFAEYIQKQGFFDFERLYDCTSPACLKRQKMQPRPMPLRLSVAYGNRKKHITINIWGKDKYGVQYVDYPPAVDAIIDAIQRMANRLDDSVVRK